MYCSALILNGTYSHCSSLTSYANVKRGMNNKGEYKFIIADPDKKLIQAVRVSAFGCGGASDI